MKGGLQQANTRELSFGGAREDRIHQFSSHPGVLRAGLYGDRPDARDGRTLVETVAADDAAVRLRHYAVKTGMRKHHAENSDGGLARGQIRRKVVGCIDVEKGLITNGSARRRIFRRGAADGDLGHDGYSIAKQIFSSRSSERR